MTTKELLLATICYADVFDYPLTVSELHIWMIKKIRQAAVHNHTVNTLSDIQSKEGYVFLSGRQSIVSLRKKRERWAGPKMQLAKQSAELLKIIPTIKLIGVTGGLAMNNAHEHDDIDFYIATCRKTMWVTRCLATVLLELYKLRRKPEDTEFQNKICLNMYVDEDHLRIPVKERDLFSAHEVLQLEPLWERDSTYEKFLNKNRWVKKFLPNAWEEKGKRQKSHLRQDYGGQAKGKSLRVQKILFRTSLAGRRVFYFSFIILEPLFRWFQLWYMQKRRSSEVVSETLIRFHPHDARVWVKAKYAVRLGKYNIPLDKIFFGR